MSTVTFMENVRSLRRSQGLSQEELAAKLGVSAQAVSKWECGMSYPDIELIIMLADLFGVTVDSLLRDTAAAADTPPHIDAELPDDGKLRVVQFIGRKMLSVDDMDPENIIPLHIENGMSCDAVLNVEVWGSVKIDGDVTGDVTANGLSVSGNNISLRNVSTSVSCGDVGGNVHTGAGAVSCGDVDGDVSSNVGPIKCGDVSGNVHTGAGTINCGDVSGNAHTGCGKIYCSSHG